MMGRHRRRCIIIKTTLGQSILFAGSIHAYSVKRSDVTGNRFEWELGENKVI